MALIPEPLDKQIARATREREERDNARIFGPVALGAVIGLVLSFVVYAGCNVLNVAFSRRVAASVAAGLIGLIGPVLADQLIAARPNWLDAGFDDRDDASRPSV